MRNSESLILLFAVGLCGCTAKPDRDLWNRACARELDFAGVTRDDELTQCLENLASHPPKFANAIARCMAAGTKTADARREEFEGCLDRPTREYLDDVEMAYTRLDSARAEIDLYQRENGRLPPDIDWLGGELEVDPWGRPHRYTILGDGSYELCSLGYDGKAGTDDDLCPGTSFIYFQF